MSRRPLMSTLFPYTTLFRSRGHGHVDRPVGRIGLHLDRAGGDRRGLAGLDPAHFEILVRNPGADADRKSTRLNSSHMSISYAVFCLKKKKVEMQAILLVLSL